MDGKLIARYNSHNNNCSLLMFPPNNCRVHTSLFYRLLLLLRFKLLCLFCNCCYVIGVIAFFLSITHRTHDVFQSTKCL